MSQEQQVKSATQVTPASGSNTSDVVPADFAYGDSLLILIASREFIALDDWHGFEIVGASGEQGQIVSTWLYSAYTGHDSENLSNLLNALRTATYESATTIIALRNSGVPVRIDSGGTHTIHTRRSLWQTPEMSGILGLENGGTVLHAATATITFDSAEFPVLVTNTSDNSFQVVARPNGLIDGGQHLFSVVDGELLDKDTDHIPSAGWKAALHNASPPPIAYFVSISSVVIPRIAPAPVRVMQIWNPQANIWEIIGDPRKEVVIGRGPVVETFYDYLWIDTDVAVPDHGPGLDNLDDVTITNPQPGDILIYVIDGVTGEGEWINVPGGSNFVTISGPPQTVTGDKIFTGSIEVPNPVDPADAVNLGTLQGLELDDLANVVIDTSGLKDGAALVWDSDTQTWVAGDPSGGGDFADYLPLTGGNMTGPLGQYGRASLSFYIEWSGGTNNLVSYVTFDPQVLHRGMMEISLTSDISGSGGMQTRRTTHYVSGTAAASSVYVNDLPSSFGAIAQKFFVGPGEVASVGGRSVVRWPVHRLNVSTVGRTAVHVTLYGRGGTDQTELIKRVTVSAPAAGAAATAHDDVEVSSGIKITFPDTVALPNDYVTPKQYVDNTIVVSATQPTALKYGVLPKLWIKP